jgi:hypothetical protein
MRKRSTSRVASSQPINLACAPIKKSGDGMGEHVQRETSVARFETGRPPTSAI